MYVRCSLVTSLFPSSLICIADSIFASIPSTEEWKGEEPAAILLNLFRKERRKEENKFKHARKPGRKQGKKEKARKHARKQRSKEARKQSSKETRKEARKKARKQIAWQKWRSGFWISKSWTGLAIPLAITTCWFPILQWSSGHLCLHQYVWIGGKQKHRSR